MSDFVEDPFESVNEQGSRLNLEDFEDAYRLADSSLRFVNFIFDRLIVGGIFMGIMFSLVMVEEMTGASGDFMGLLLILILPVSITAYYAVMEKIYGKTLGKMLSKTRVVDVSGKPISWGQALGRTFARLIPFEPFSILFSDKSIGWHDSLSNTRVVRDQRHI